MSSTKIFGLPIYRVSVLILPFRIADQGFQDGLYAGFGGATLAVLWQGISKTAHISIGMASFLVALGMILFVLIYDRSQIHIGTIIYQVVYSGCVDLFANCHRYSSHMWINFMIMLVGVVLFAVGTGLYASASLGRGSYEAVTFALAEKNKWQVKVVRMISDILVVVIGVLLGGRFGICTIVTVLISGPIIQFVNEKVKQLKKHLPNEH